MNIVIVSRITGNVTRSNWADFAVANGKDYSLTDLATFADQLRVCGFSTTRDFVLADVTPTEADVVAFIEAKACELSEKVGGLYARVSINATKYSQKGGGIVAHECQSYVDRDIGRIAETLSDAMQASVLAMAPENRARELRAKAAEMLTEAGALEPLSAL